MVLKMISATEIKVGTNVIVDGVSLAVRSMGIQNAG